MALLTVLLLVAASASTQQAVGTVRSVRGFVEIDAFGTGRFIEAVAGDTLYEQSVIRTDYDGTARLEVSGEMVTVAPRSQTPVLSFLTRQERGGLGAFIQNLLRGIAESLSAASREEVASAGLRHSNVAESGGMGFIQDFDADSLFEQAQLAIEEGDYQSAAELLGQIESPDDGTFDVEEFFVTFAVVQMQLGDFYAAMRTSFDYARAEPSADEAAYLPAQLQLVAGISAYYVGKNAVAAGALDAYIDSVGIERAAADAISIRVRLHEEAGEQSQASALLSRANSARPSFTVSVPGDR